jgi:hypothetical protein
VGLSKKKGPRHHATAPTQTPNRMEVNWMIPKAAPQRTGETSAEKRGGTEPAAKLNPDPHRPHSPIEIQGVRL